MAYISNQDYWMRHAIDIIYATYGDRVSIEAKNKDLVKYGRSEQVQTGTKTTIMTLPTGTYNETYVSTNIIDKVSSSSGSDTGTIVIEGHTVSGSDLTFVSQTATLNGQTAVTLTTPLCRANRIYNTGTSDLVGAVYVHESDTLTGGVPDTASKVHCMTRTGENQSEKASTSISSVDYWIVTGVYADVLQKTTANAEIGFEVREFGKTFRKQFDFSASNSSGTFRTGYPYIIVPKNCDVRLRALASGANTIVAGGIFGALAKII